MMPVYVWIIAVAAALVLDFFLAREFQRIAISKGWNGKKYFFFAFFLGLIGYLMVVALPDRGSLTEGSYESSDLPEL